MAVYCSRFGSEQDPAAAQGPIAGTYARLYPTSEGAQITSGLDSFGEVLRWLEQPNVTRGNVVRKNSNTKM